MYLSHPIVPTSAWTGSPACFLFSVTLGLRFPYHGRTVTPDENVQYPLALYVDRNHVFVGNGDLVIDDTLTNGSSELENCYGLSGLEPGSKESQCMLAGSALFTIDTLELWAINIF